MEPAPRSPRMFAHHLFACRSEFLKAGVAAILLLGVAVSRADFDEAVLKKLELPNEPGMDRSLIPLWDNSRPVQSEEEAAGEAPRLRKLEGAVIGQNRLLLRATFDQKPLPETLVFRIYIDTDNNSDTGRQDSGPPTQGVDLMFALNPTKDGVLEWAADGDYDAQKAESGCRYAWDGNALLVTIDTPFASSNPLPIRLYALSQKKEGVRSSSSEAVTYEFPHPSKPLKSLADH